MLFGLNTIFPIFNKIVKSVGLLDEPNYTFKCVQHNHIPYLRKNGAYSFVKDSISIELYVLFRIYLYLTMRQRTPNNHFL